MVFKRGELTLTFMSIYSFFQHLSDRSVKDLKRYCNGEREEHLQPIIRASKHT